MNDCNAVVSCAIIARNFAAILAGVAKIIAHYFSRGFVCKYCMQCAAIPAGNNYRLSNVLENIQQAKVLQPMTAFGGIVARNLFPSRC